MQSSKLPLRGREPELAALLTMIDSADAGRGGAVVVGGEPGIGKSRLVAEAAGVARQRGHRVMAGAVTEFERERPFGSLIDALALDQNDPPSALSELAGLLSGRSIRTSAPIDGGLKHVAIQETLNALRRLASDQPTMLVLEDLHWADESTLAFVDRFVTSLTDSTLSLVATRRFWPRRPRLDRIEERAEVTTIRLRPLAPDELRSIALDVLGEAAPDELLARIDLTGGSPLFARLVAESSLHDSSSDLTLSDAIRRHLDFVSPETLDLLGSASVIGARFSLDDLSLVLGSPVGELLAPIREAVECGLLEDANGQLAFRHDLVWHAIYDALPVAVRRAMHREIAHVLAKGEVSLDRIVSHALIGARRSSPDDVRLLAAAADQVAPRDPSTGAGLYQRALELCPQDDPLQPVLQRSFITSLLWSGQFYRARTRAEAILEHASDPTVRGDLRRAIGRVLVYQGDVRASLDQVEEGLRDRQIPDPQRARLLADVSLRRLVCFDRARAFEAGEEAVALANTMGDGPALAVGRCALSRVASFDGDVNQAIELAAEAMAETREGVAETIELLQPPLYHGLALLESDQPNHARPEFERGLDLAMSLGSVWIVPLFHVGLAMEDYLGGRWEDAAIEAERGIDLARASNTAVWVPWAHAILALITSSRGETASTRHIDAIERHLRRFGSDQFGHEWIAWAMIRYSAGQLRNEEAIEAGMREWHVSGSGRTPGLRRLFGVDLVRMLRSGERTSDARSVAAVLEEAATISGTATDRGRSLVANGLIDSSAAQLLRGAELLESAGRASECVRARTDAAETLAADRRTGEAKDLASDVADWLQRRGADADLAPVDALLRSLGVHRGSRAKRSRATKGWEAVTPTEMKVLELVAEGLTNKQIGDRLFVSPRTVESHISNLFPKLEASSRTELAARFFETASRENP